MTIGHHIAGSIELHWDFTLLDEGIRYMLVKTRYHSTGKSLTSTGRREEGRDTSASSTDSLSQRTLRTKLNANLPCQVFLFQRLIVPEKRQDQAADLPGLCENRKSTSAFLAGIVGNGL